MYYFSLRVKEDNKLVTQIFKYDGKRFMQQELNRFDLEYFKDVCDTLQVKHNLFCLKRYELEDLGYYEKVVLKTK